MQATNTPDTAGESVSFWARALAGAPPRLELYHDSRGREPAVGEVDEVELTLQHEVTAAVRKIGQRFEAPLFAVMLASAWALLARHTGQDDIVVLARSGGRRNPVPTRGQLHDEPSFATLVQRAKAALRLGEEHDASPVEVLRAAAASGLELEFPVLLWMLGEGEVEPPPTAVLDPALGGPVLMISVQASGDTIELRALLRAGRFTTSEVERLLVRWAVLLRAVVSEPAVAVSRAPILPDWERRMIVSQWNDTTHDWGHDVCVHSLVEQQVARTPDRIAVIAEAGQLTFRELDARAEMVAQALLRRGVKTESLVAICAERSLELVVGLLGILKAGAAYVPLDPDYPRERHAYMLADSQAPVLLTQRRLVESLPEFAGEVLVLEDLGADPGARGERLLADVSPDNLVYVMYTSGSTGRPKGVMNIHRGVVNRLLDMQRTIPLAADDRLLQKTPCGFDISVYEFFWPLLTGATLVMARPGGHRDPAYLCEVIRAEAITTIHFVPPMLAAFLEQFDLSGCGSLRRVMCTGEILPPAVAQRCHFRLGVELYNLYGPTEAAIEVTAHLCDPHRDVATVPIGKPITNSTIYLLDRHGEPVPPGAPGELFIGGVQVSRGYWRRPELTAERFVPDRFAAAPNQRLYRTGDLARWCSDGVIEFLGRLDHQVKIRGFRVELGEIEAVIREHQPVRDVVVVVRTDPPGDKRLAAYLVLERGPEITTGDAWTEPHLAAVVELITRKLPAYMLPAAFMVLDTIPVLPNGKVDRKALPRPEYRRDPAEEQRAPQTPAELKLAAIWAEILGVTDCGVTADLLALGGHSLHVAQIIARVRRDLGCEVSFVECFAHPTIEALARLVDGRAGSGDGDPRLEFVKPEHDGPRPLSYAEERLFFLHQLAPESTAYHCPFAFRIGGECREDLLAAAILALVQRHEILRTRFIAVDGVPRRIIDAPPALPIAHLDLRSAADVEAALAEALAVEAARPFNLAEGPLIRAGIINTGESERVLWLTLHHIVTDGWSDALLLRELRGYYEAALAGAQPSLPRPLLTYADYANWQRTAKFDARVAAALTGWTQRLAGAPTRLDLPTDRPRPALPLSHGARRMFTVLANAMTPVHELARRCGATLSMTLLALFAAVLRRVAGQEELVIGLTAAARSHVELEGVAGFFVNTLPIRIDLADDPRLPALVARVREATLAAYQGEDVPFERIVRELQLPRDPACPPLVQVAYAPQPRGETGLTLPGCEVTPVPVHGGGAIFDLTLLTWETDDGGLDAAIEYSTDLFDAWRIDALVAILGAVIAGVRTAPQATVSTLALLSTDEQQSVLEQSRGPTMEVDLDGGVHGFFEEQAQRRPGATALIAGKQHVSFAELDRRANHLAHRLRDAGVGTDSLVGVVAERSIATIVGVLGILKAGGAYVPLDPTYPAQRLGFILEDTGLKWIVATSESARVLPPHAASIITPETSTPGSEHDERPPIAIGARDLAYVLFTSGSTGRPKGVAMGHGALRNLTAWHMGDTRLGRCARTLQFAALGFDVSAQEMFTTWAVGGAVVLVSENTRRDALALLGLLDEHSVERLFLPFVFLQHLADAASSLGRVPGSLCDVVTAGEQLKITPSIRWFFSRLPNCCLHNHYGPTEAHVVTAHVLRPPAAAWPSLPPIGEPIPNTRIYILDPQHHPVPAGVPGELYIAGDALARGYHGRPDLTSDRFVVDPFVAGERMYRTGDIARRLFGGSIEYLGRADHQVKIRGVRVELGEVEAVLAEHPAVAAAAAIVREDDHNEKRLVAYVSTRSGEYVDALGMRAHMRARLPEAMVPSVFVVLPQLPLLSSGKVDRRALPAPRPADYGLSRRVGESPRSALEQAIAAIWKELLHLDHVGVDDPFFDLGGHSLLLAQVQAALVRRLQLKVNIVDLFQHPTIRSLAARLSAEAEEPAAVRAPVRERSAGHGADERAIAIVGMAGRFPSAASVDALWRGICDGQELISFFTREEVEAAGMDPAIARSARFVPAIGVMPDAMCFDAAFFGYGPREARLLDPQQRVLLEIAWAAMEDAGYNPRHVDRPVGVFAGCEVPRYWIERLGSPGAPLSMEEYEVGFGNMNDTLATRVSYELGLRGPAFTLQTACSTSLVAVHVACRSILAGECHMALAGGSVVMPPDRLGHVSEGGSVVAPDGHCRPFDADAQGIVGGNGVGVVVLKRLSDAIADGDSIRAVILATAINNDGARKIGFTAPSIPGQCEVIQTALEGAGVDPGTIGLVEAHGTATRLGDPIEVAALTQAYRQYTDRRRYCVLGSIKGNIGHLGAAAGVTGLIKAALALERQVIPPTLHFRRANPELELDTSPFFVNPEPLAWPRADAPRRAAVSSFGVGGTNAHAVLEEAPLAAPSGPSRPVHMLLLSARTGNSLAAGATRLCERLDEPDCPPLADVAYTLARGRAPMAQRRVVVARTQAAAARALRDHDRTWIAEGVAPGHAPRIAFLFPGGGTQEVGMGQELYAADPTYRDAFDAAADRFAAALGFDVRALVFAGEARREEAARELLRPTRFLAAIFCTEYALARTLIALGIVPAAMTGHSLGEYTAATIAEVLSLDDAAYLLAERGRLHESLEVEAGLLVVPLAEAQLTPRLPAGVDIAAINAEDSCVVAGEAGTIVKLASELARDGIDCKRLPVAGASHCALVEPFLPRMRECAARLRRVPPAIPLVSNVTGDWLTDEDARDPGYWARHLRGTVRFAEGIGRLLADPDLLLIEVGPGRTLAGLTRRHPAAQGRPVIATMAARGGRRSDLEEFSLAVGQLWCRGVDVKWDHHFAGEQRRRVPLPTYAFERVHHEHPVAPAHRGGKVHVEVPVFTQAAAPGSVPAADEVPADPLLLQLQQIIGEVLGVASPAATDNFFDLGGSSFLALRVRVRFEERASIKLPVHAFVEFPTLRDLAAYARTLAPAATEAATTTVPEAPPASRLAVPLRPGPGRELFLIQPIGGTVFTYLPLVRRLDPSLAVIGLRASGMEPDEPIYDSMPAIAGRYVAEIRARGSKGPYLLAGHSAGGVIAFEVARQLIADGEFVDLLAMLDTSTPDLARRIPLRTEEDIFRVAELMRSDSSESYEQFAHTLRTDPRFRSLVRATWEAIGGYVPAPLAVDTLFVKARAQPDPDEARADLGWMEFVGGSFTRAIADGDHFSMMDEPSVQSVAALLNRSIRQYTVRTA